MIAKGNRSQQVTDACKKHGGFYLGSIGGPAAVLAEENIKKVECIDFPELGMEAVWKIEVEDFPAFILVDDKGNDFFKQACWRSVSGMKCARYSLALSRLPAMVSAILHMTPRGTPLWKPLTSLPISSRRCSSLQVLKVAAPRS
jgi:hypothetical protein